MKQASEGKPEMGQSARTLGARAGRDIPVDDDGAVVGGTGGMSVTPGSEAADQRRTGGCPPDFGKLEPVRSEWRLIAASHNLLKLHNNLIAPATS